MESLLGSAKPAEPGTGSRPSDFWRWMLALAAGFSLPILACYGLIVVSALGLRLLSTNAAGQIPIGTPDTGFGPAVGLIHVDGLIVEQRSPLDSSASSSAQEITDHIRQAAEDPNVRSLLLVVNSPGGSVVASDEIYHALTQLDKPIVVSMGELAASGGYYISAAADWIVANPNTLTGSIGVISEFPSAAGLLDKIGVDFIVITSGPRKDFGSPYREMTREERRYWQAIVDEVYDGFVGVVAEGRGLSEQAVRELADGSVYTGRQALDLGLVDQLGYQGDALAKAAELGGIEGEPRVIEYQTAPTFLDLLRFAFSRSALPSVEEVMTWLGHPSLAARWLGP